MLPAGVGREIRVAIITIDEPFYIPRMMGSLIRSRPQFINFVAIIVLPTRPNSMSSWEFILNQMQVFGLTQFLKIGGMYTVKKSIAANFTDTYSLAKVAKNTRFHF